MRTTWILIVSLATSLLAPVVAPPFAAGAKKPACPGGRYLVPGTTLTGALDASPPDVILVEGKTIALESGCNPVKATLRGTAKGTKVRARWKSCPGVEGKAVLTGTMMEQCRSFAGTFTAKSAGISKPFLASLSRCGDGIWDVDGGEECDAGLGPCGDLCNACACTAGGATTTTMTAPSSTTVPGGSTSTTTTTTISTTSTTVGGGPTSSSTTTSPVPTTTSTSSAVPTTTSTSSPVPTTTSTSSPVPTTTSTSSPLPTTTSTTSPIPTTSSTTFVFPTSSSTSTGAPNPTTTSTMPVLPTTSTTSTTLPGPDLRPHAWMSPGSAPDGAAIAVEITVRNFGTTTATAPWWDYILISNDLVLGNDQAIGFAQHMTNLAASMQYTQLIQPIIPAGLPPGTYYLFMHTDATNAVAESNDNNNIGAFVQIIVN